MPIRPSDPFFWRHYEGPIILVCVRWYLRLPLSYRQVADLMTERGLRVHASCIWRWVQAFGPELDKRCRPHLKSTNKSYRVDETYTKVKGQDRYLYRAVDSTGQTIGAGWIRSTTGFAALNEMGPDVSKVLEHEQCGPDQTGSVRLRYGICADSVILASVYQLAPNGVEPIPFQANCLGQPSELHWARVGLLPGASPISLRKDELLQVLGVISVPTNCRLHCTAADLNG